MINYDLVKAALAEDLAGGVDVTSVATIAADAELKAEFVARESGVVVGIEIAKAVLTEVGVAGIEILVQDGASVIAGDVLIKVTGNARAILLAERTALNFLGHLSGIATLTSQWVKEIVGTNCQVRDTRKTTPGWRE
uniref:nicotinate-nucleotide diphosphorylase n=1 Tax=Candidatus Planktophila sp. TaxID=2175601 RepID=UPI00404A92BB